MTDRDGRWLMPFAAGALAGSAAFLLAKALAPRRGLDPRLIGRLAADAVPPVVVVPGIMGSSLLRPDGTPVWLNMRNAFGYYSLELPLKLPLQESRDDIVPGALIGTDDMLPRLFGFTEYADLVDLLETAGFRSGRDSDPRGLVYQIFGYDWRRDLVDAARRLHEALEALADARGEPGARFNVIGHSMGGLVARYYLRYGTAEPDPGAPVTWAGAERIQNLVLVAVPNGGGVGALEGLLLGNRVGLSYTTLAPSIVARMPSVYQLLPPKGVSALLDHRWDPISADLHDVATWERMGWGPFAAAARRGDDGGDPDLPRAFLAAVLDRARAFHAALARHPETPCPTRVVILGGDCLPTLARVVVPDRPGAMPRFEPTSRGESEVMLEAGDGRVTRASVLASHLPEAEQNEQGCGLPEAGSCFFGSTDHHGVYAEPTFQSVLLRLLLRAPSRSRAAVAAAAATAVQAVQAAQASQPVPGAVPEPAGPGPLP